MVQQSQSKPSLPTNRAFVVQFRPEAEVEPGRFAGRVEHVVSGRTVQFHSLEELLTFIGQILHETQ